MAIDSERWHLHEVAVRAFQAAKQASEKNPQPGTSEWDEWQVLVRKAIAANRAFIRDEYHRTRH